MASLTLFVPIRSEVVFRALPPAGGTDGDDKSTRGSPRDEQRPVVADRHVGAVGRRLVVQRFEHVRAAGTGPSEAPGSRRSGEVRRADTDPAVAQLGLR